MNPGDLAELIHPSHTAVLTMEMQRGVVGDLAAFPALRAAVEESGLLESVGIVCRAARAAGSRVVHCTVGFRPDGLGFVSNCSLLSAAEKLNAGTLNTGSEGTELVAELGLADSDVVVARSHGLTPFTSTDLDQILRNMGITTIVAVGSSINVGIIGMVLSAVDLGYRVVVPADSVVGIPPDYGHVVMSNTIALLATIVSVEDLVKSWG